MDGAEKLYFLTIINFYARMGCFNVNTQTNGVLVPKELFVFIFVLGLLLIIAIIFEKRKQRK